MLALNALFRNTSSFNYNVIDRKTSHFYFFYSDDTTAYLYKKLFIKTIYDYIGWARVKHPGSTSGGEILHHPIHLPHRPGGRLHIEVNFIASPLSSSSMNF
jgi:hypothetical protein